MQRYFQSIQSIKIDNWRFYNEIQVEKQWTNTKRNCTTNSTKSDAAFVIAVKLY